MSCYHFHQYNSQLLLLFEFTNPPQEWALALIMYRIKGAGRKVLAGDAVLWSGSDGGRCSLIGEPLEVFDAHEVTQKLPYSMEFLRRSLQSLCFTDYSVTRGREFSRVLRPTSINGAC